MDGRLVTGFAVPGEISPSFSRSWPYGPSARSLLVLPGKRLLETGLGRTGADLLLRAINVAVWLGFAGAYLWATCRPLSYLKLWHNAPKGLTVDFRSARRLSEKTWSA
jgi:hypothetical protein